MKRKDIILYTAAFILTALAFFAFAAIVKAQDPYVAVICPLILAGLISGVVGFVSLFKFKGLYPLAVTLLFLISVPVVFGTEQIDTALDFASFGVPHIVVNYFCFFAGLIGRWYGLNKRNSE